ncbi:hypothetical protein CRG98_043067, partial [Punica granatum]
DFASPDFASGYSFQDSASTLLPSGLRIPGYGFPNSASTLLLSGLRVPGLFVRLLLSGLRVHFTGFRTSRPRTLRPVIAFRTPRPLYCFQDFASLDFSSGYCFLDSASTLLGSGLRVPGLCVRTSRPWTFRPVIAFWTPRPLYWVPDFASPDFASGYSFPDSASTLLLSGLRVPGLFVRLLLSGLRVHFTGFRTSRPRTLRPVIAFRTPRPLYCFQDFASLDFSSGLRVPGLFVRLLLSGLRVHFTGFRTSRPRTLRPVIAFRTPRPLYCFQDFASLDFSSGLRVPGLFVRLLLSGLRVHFTGFRTSRPRTLRPVIAFRTPRPLYCFQDFASLDFSSGLRVPGLFVRLLLSGLRVHFTGFRTSRPRTLRPVIAFRTPRPLYCFQDFASLDFSSGLRVPGLFVRLLLSGLRVHFTGFRTSRPRTLRPVIAFRTPRPLYCFQDFASLDFSSGYCFLDSASTLLGSGLRVPGLCVRFPDSASTLLLSGLRVPGLFVRLLLSGLRVHFTGFRTSRPRTLRPVIAFRTPRPLYCFQDFASPDFASPDFASGYCFPDSTSPDSASGYYFPDSASTLLLSGFRVPGLCVRL